MHCCQPLLKLLIFLYWIWSWFCMHFLLQRDLSSTQWAEVHLPGLNWISPLDKPLNAVGMSCKVQVKSSSQWERNSLLRDVCVSPCASSFILCSLTCNSKDISLFAIVFPAYYTIMGRAQWLNQRASYFWSTFLCLISKEEALWLFAFIPHLKFVPLFTKIWDFNNLHDFA